jgi:hypothetical protein
MQTPNYSIALEEQLKLAREIRSDTVYTMGSSGMANQILSGAVGGRWGKKVNETLPEDVLLVRNSLNHATPIFIAREIIKMLSAALDSLPDTTGLRPTDCPVPLGWYYLEEPVPVPIMTPGGYLHYMRAFLAEAHEGDVQFIAFGHSTQPGRPQFKVGDVVVDDMASLTSLGTYVWRREDTLQHNEEEEKLLTEFMEKWDGKDFPYRYVDSEPPYYKEVAVPAEEYAKHIFEFNAVINRWFVALAHFSSQRIVRLNAKHLDRATRRRIPEWKPAEVLAVEFLRRVDYPEREDGHHEEGRREWASRWIVAGHWRNQWYPTEQRHKPKWIEAYVKGPADKPVKASTKLFAVVR